MMEHSLSVIIPVYNDKENLERCLTSLFDTEYNNFEMIVVDDGSQDKLSIITNKFPCKIIKLSENHGQAHARNVGVRVGIGDVILFTDADCIAMENWVKIISDRLVQARQVSGDIVAVCGRVTSKKGFFQMCHTYAGYGYIQNGPRRFMDYLNTACVAIFREAFNRVGGFSEDMRVSEDPELALKFTENNYKILFEPEIFVLHNHGIRTFKQFIQKHSSWGRSLGLKLELKHRMRSGKLTLFLKNPITHFLLIVPIAIATTLRIVLRNIKYDNKILFYAFFIFIAKIFYRWNIFLSSLTQKL